MASAKSPLKSSNLWTDVATIVISLILGVAGFFFVLPDLVASQSLGADFTDLIGSIKAGAWGAVLAAAIKIWNAITHLLKD